MCGLFSNLEIEAPKRVNGIAIALAEIKMINRMELAAQILAIWCLPLKPPLDKDHFILLD